MNDFDAFIASVSSPMGILAGFDRQVAVRAGINPVTVRKWSGLAKVYFGPTRFTRKQRHAVRLARETSKSLDQLVFIESCVRGVSDDAGKWGLRLALLSVRGTYDTLKRHAADILPNHGNSDGDGGGDGGRGAPALGVRFTGSYRNTRTMTVTGDEHVIAAVEFALRRDLRPDRPVAGQMYDAFVDLIRTTTTNNGDGAGAGGVAAAVPRPVVLIPLDDYTRILAGDGDDVVLGLSDGTTMTGAQYLAWFHGSTLEVAVFHPQAGAVNLYDTKRLANAKQRDLARMVLTTCPVPGCRHAADNCEVHHVTAWSRGGLTNMDNLSILCRYHNRTNDDDPAKQNRGRIEIRAGTPTWVSPRGTPVANNRHPYGAMKQLFGT
ncbi:HNH endonuclease signature motif containing protein [Corynebacterium sp. P4-C1]|uniref:HNH endonuclease signature motif containing protein n=2 Tax=unclassified Corynebacterium TaxID=2624378 RepID=UPI00265D422E|nr:HNH endonuclease signature motif containing protein [Corynebacterium sp. P4-C1]WKK56065.1 HNH endonuclease signature motif containing protein [Corynebacterium sp. P4-C1]